MPLRKALWPRRYVYLGCATHTGCDFVGLAMLRNWRFVREVDAEAVPPPPPTAKIGMLLGESKPSPSQGAAEFDMSAFGL